MNSKTAGNLLPMQVRVDYLRSTGSSTMANISLQFENSDLQFAASDGSEKSRVNLFGRIVTMTRRPVTTFEKTLEIVAAPGLSQAVMQQRSLYQKSVPLAPGRYRVSLVAKDTVGGGFNNYEIAIDVPSFEENKLALSSLIFADKIEKLPAKSIAGGAPFAIGGTRVRPRPGNKFTSAEKLGIYLQAYNFLPEQGTQKPSGSIEYEIDKAGSDERLLDFQRRSDIFQTLPPVRLLSRKCFR